MEGKSTSLFSHWEKTVFFDKIDLVIIGGGIVGTNAAIRLKELHPDWKIVILERGTLPLGASTRNAGFACFGSMTELLDDLENQNQKEVFDLLERRWKGLQRLRQRVGDQQLNYYNYGAYELFHASEEYEFKQCMDKLETFNQVLKEITGIEEVFEVKDQRIKDFGLAGIKHLIYNKAEGQLNPGRMMQELWKLARSMEIEIHCGVEVNQLQNHDHGVNLWCNKQLQFSAARALLATNGFTKRLFPHLEVLPARNQVLITKPVSALKLKGCFHYDKGYYYFRNVGDRILLGGGRNLAKEEEQTDEFGHTDIIQNKLKQLLSEMILPDNPFEIDHWWSGILGVGPKKAPIVERIEPNIFTAVRLGGMGVAIGTLVGEQAAEYITDIV